MLEAEDAAKSTDRARLTRLKGVHEFLRIIVYFCGVILQAHLPLQSCELAMHAMQVSHLICRSFSCS
jgi:hypothetical protein